MPILLWTAFLSVFAPLKAVGATPYYCFFDENAERPAYYCRDDKIETAWKTEVPPIAVNWFAHELSERGVELVSPEEYFKRRGVDWMKEVAEGPSSPLECPELSSGIEQEYRTYLTAKEFNNLDENHPLIQRLKTLALMLHEAGVCDLNVRQEGYNSIDVYSNDDALQQFLCIANSESVFGTDNLGMGGRGPWGIHPMHNLPKGATAYSDGKKFRLKKDGLCYPGDAVTRDAKGAEVKKNELYKAPKVILANASCALKLYQQSGPDGGFSSWGRTKKWGSNRHCSKNFRENLQFTRYLGELACCSSECKDDASKKVSL